jgi:hypothetical protein
MFKNLSAYVFALIFSQSLFAQNAVQIDFEADYNSIDQELEEESFRPAYAHLIAKDLDLQEYLLMDASGTQRELRLILNSEKALGIAPYFEELQIPKSGKLWFESLDGKLISGPYQSDLNADGGSYMFPLSLSSSLVMRYTQAALDLAPKLKLAGLAHAFRDVAFAPVSARRDFGDSKSCQVNINCSEGSAWQDQSKAVMRISVKVGSDFFWCTGSLVNNTNQDCKPYVLTADHCGDGASSADLNDWVFYFQYESANCSNPSSEGALANKSITGCSLKANTGGAGDTDSDFYLVELSQEVPQFYNPFFAGWDRKGVTSPSGVSIHHPSGDIKKISTYGASMVSDSWGGTVQNTHWTINWLASANGHGVTESGSSGSPIFNDEGQVMGMLTGGLSDCTAGGGSGPDEPDSYGKFSYAWESEGSQNSKQLKPWLDPMNSGLTQIDGIAWPCLEDPLTGIELENESQEFGFYPNPVSNQLNWTIPNISSIHLIGLDTREYAIHVQNNSADLSELAAGVYLVRLFDNAGKIYQSKIVKQ